MNKTSNILIRVSDKEHNIIKLKSKLFGLKKSQLIVSSTMSSWIEPDNNDGFKQILEEYKKATYSDKEIIVDLLFEYYRNFGFPHTNISDSQKLNRIERIINTKSVLLPNDELQQNVVGIELPNSFHPHMDNVKYSSGNLCSPMETYRDDLKFKDCIKTWLELEKKPNPAGIRRILKTRNGSRGITNFKPAISQYIYKTYCPQGGAVLDPCSGFSGRLVGAIASNKSIHYTGIDPEEQTGIGNMKCASFFKSHYDFRFSYHMSGAEDTMPNLKENSYDLIFTSPPYFNIENYSNSTSQSHNKFSTYNSWVENFLSLIVSESKRLLKKDGYLIINTKDYEKYPIASDLLKICEKTNFNLIKTYKMRLANNEFNRNKKGQSNFHHEPIFVFKK